MTGSPEGLRARTSGAAETRALAARVARCCRTGDVVLLAGGLGAGKTTFAQGFAAGLGVEEPVTSPTFTLVRHYRCRGVPVSTLLHADVYRLDDLREVEDLGLGELVEDDAVALVEWGDVAEPVLGAGALTVRITSPSEEGSDDERVLEVEAGAGDWAGRREDLASALAPWSVASDASSAPASSAPQPSGADRRRAKAARPDGAR